MTPLSKEDVAQASTQTVEQVFKFDSEDVVRFIRAQNDQIVCLKADIEYQNDFATLARADLVAENERLKAVIATCPEVFDNMPDGELGFGLKAPTPLAFASRIRKRFDKTISELNDQLTATRTALEDMEKQRDYWINDRKALQFADDAKIAELSNALAAAEARESKLRGWIEQWCKFDSLNMDLKKWLSFSAEYRAFQRDDSALREMIAGVYEECAKACEEERDARVLDMSRMTATNCAEAIRALAEKAKGE